MDNSDHSKIHKGPNLGILGIVFTVLFNLGLYFVISFSPESPHFPGPWESADVISKYFLEHPGDVLLCAFFQFGSAIPLGIYTATAVSRLRFFGISAAGPYIGLFGGFVTSINLAISAFLLWVISYPGIAESQPVLRALYYFMFAIGGVGYSVPKGLLIAGLAVSAGLTNKIPKWLMISGIAIAVCGELSWISLVIPKALFLIPLTRFPGFIWLIVFGFILPKEKQI
ncbi:hypothetical protein ACQV5M_15155 [Leptospira sp. SA-E8]|uniref:hypothetical protein n=1 Tax=Leptospira sp. SA-E8 TaxID=3422259 RepID=UPI003EBFF6D5